MLPNHLSFTDERSRRHFLAVVTAAVAMTPFVAAIKAFAESWPSDHDEDEDEGRNNQHGCEPSGGRPPKCNCVLRGTEILTADGMVPVESLEIGDLVLTESGYLKPIKWIARNSFQKVRGSKWDESVLPIRIARLAIDTDVPARELYLSPWHSVFINKYLIPVQYLVNGDSITRSVPTGLEVIEYFHIVFEQHEVVIYAEGVPVESLQVINGRPEGFTNSAEYDRLYGPINAPPMLPYAPILGYYGGRQNAAALIRLAVSNLLDVRDPVQVLHDRLAARAELLKSQPWTSDQAICV